MTHEFLRYEWDSNDLGTYPVFYFHRTSDGVDERKALFTMRAVYHFDGNDMWSNYVNIPEDLRYFITENPEEGYNFIPIAPITPPEYIPGTGVEVPEIGSLLIPILIIGAVGLALRGVK